MARFGRLSEFGMAAYYVPWDELRHRVSRKASNSKRRESSILVEQSCDRSTVGTHVPRTFPSFLRFPLRSRRPRLWLWSGVPAMNGTAEGWVFVFGWFWFA